MSISKNRVVALLPIKANSERLKGKNFKEFAGKPLFRWVLDTLLEVPEIDKVVINTDARHILAESGLRESEKIIIRDRKPEICGDLVSMNSIIGDDIKNVEGEIYLMTHTTNPLLSKKTIQTALRCFLNALTVGDADSLFTVDKVQTRFYRADATAVNHDPENLVRTQDLDPWFRENSNLYIFTRDCFFSTGTRIGRKPIMLEGPRNESIDIDDQQDWDLAVVAAQFFRDNRD